MAPEKIESFIDKKILEKFSDSSNSIESTINYLYENINKFSARDSYINVSLSYLIKNWDVINFKKKIHYLLCNLRKKKSEGFRMV